MGCIFLPPDAAVLPTHRLSPKNQVTIPSKARSLLGEGEAVVFGRTHSMPNAEGTQTFPILYLLTASEMARRERAIRDDQSKSAVEREILATKLHSLVEDLAIDGQNRVVLPARFVSHLGLDRDVFFVVTNSAIQIWNPTHYLTWAGLGPDGVVGADRSLDSYLFL
jgi:DNA-binding transcriptional regulator/RsmH inhibitor MraZ